MAFDRGCRVLSRSSRTEVCNSGKSGHQREMGFYEVGGHKVPINRHGFGFLSEMEK